MPVLKLSYITKLFFMLYISHNQGYNNMTWIQGAHLDSGWDSHFYPSLTLSTPVGQNFQDGLNEGILLYLKS